MAKREYFIILLVLLLALASCTQNDAINHPRNEGQPGRALEQPISTTLLSQDGTLYSITVHPNNESSNGLIIVRGETIDAWNELIPLFQETHSVITIPAQGIENISSALPIAISHLENRYDVESNNIILPGSLSVKAINNREELWGGRPVKIVALSPIPQEILPVDGRNTLALSKTVEELDEGNIRLIKSFISTP